MQKTIIFSQSSQIIEIQRQKTLKITITTTPTEIHMAYRLNRSNLN